MVGNSKADARMRLAAGRHHMRSFMRRQEKVSAHCSVWGNINLYGTYTYDVRDGGGWKVVLLELHVLL